MYSDVDHRGTAGYWSGFYTTRPRWKKASRSLESSLRAAEIVFTMAFNSLRNSGRRNRLKRAQRLFPKLVSARRTLALFQHHDAITGTAKARVVFDYGQKLLAALEQLEAVQAKCVGLLLYGKADSVVSAGPSLLTSARTVVVVYNPLAEPRQEYVGFWTHSTNLTVVDARGRKIPHQVSPRIESTEGSEALKYVGSRLHFLATLSSLGISVYVVETGRERLDGSDLIENDVDTGEDYVSIENGKIEIVLNRKTGKLMYIVKENKVIPLEVELSAYETKSENSGAYLLSPKRGEMRVDEFGPPTVTLLRGSLFSEIRVLYGPFLSTTYRLYRTKGVLAEAIETRVKYDCGRILSGRNYDMFIRFRTDLKGTRFYTDANGRGTKRRKFVERLGIEGNYYPMSGLAYVEDEESRLAVVADHSHGAASLEEGSLEVMLERRGSGDDGRGIGEGVLDNLPSDSQFLVVYGRRSLLDLRTPALGRLLLHPSRKFLSVSRLPPQDSGPLLSRPLPRDLHLLNLRTLSFRDGPTSSALLVLHDESSPPRVGRYRRAFGPDTAFNRLPVKSLSKTSLTGLYEYESYVDFDDIWIERNSITAIKIIFE